MIKAETFVLKLIAREEIKLSITPGSYTSKSVIDASQIILRDDIQLAKSKTLHYSNMFDVTLPVSQRPKVPQTRASRGQPGTRSSGPLPLLPTLGDGRRKQAILRRRSSWFEVLC